MQGLSIDIASNLQKKKICQEKLKTRKLERNSKDGLKEKQRKLETCQKLRQTYQI